MEEKTEGHVTGADDQPVAVPLIERLRSVPLDAVLRIDAPNALGCMDTRSIPVGRLCHEAADALGVAPSLPLSMTDAEIDAVTRQQWGEQLGVMVQAHRAYARAILVAPGVSGPVTGWKTDKLGSSLAWPADTSTDGVLVLHGGQKP